MTSVRIDAVRPWSVRLQMATRLTSERRSLNMKMVTTIVSVHAFPAHYIEMGARGGITPNTRCT